MRQSWKLDRYAIRFLFPSLLDLHLLSPFQNKSLLLFVLLLKKKNIRLAPDLWQRVLKQDFEQIKRYLFFFQLLILTWLRQETPLKYFIKFYSYEMLYSRSAAFCGRYWSHQERIFPAPSQSKACEGNY